MQAAVEMALVQAAVEMAPAQPAATSSDTDAQGLQAAVPVTAPAASLESESTSPPTHPFPRRLMAGAR